jgi:hypothetical protein
MHLLIAESIYIGRSLSLTPHFFAAPFTFYCPSRTGRVRVSRAAPLSSSLRGEGSGHTVPFAHLYQSLLVQRYRRIVCVGRRGAPANWVFPVWADEGGGRNGAHDDANEDVEK